MHKPTDLYEACRGKGPEEIIADLDYTSRTQRHQDKPALAALSKKLLELGFTDDQRREASEVALSIREKAQALLDVLWEEIVREEEENAAERIAVRIERIDLPAA